MFLLLAGGRWLETRFLLLLFRLVCAEPRRREARSDGFHNLDDTTRQRSVAPGHVVVLD
jgi:hypothetical protein